LTKIGKDALVRSNSALAVTIGDGA